MPKKPLTISDHALVRWLERVNGIDMEFFRGEFRRALAGSVGEYVPIGEFTATVGGVAFVVRDGKVITTIDRGGGAR
jgi:hypothetical protein